MIEIKPKQWRDIPALKSWLNLEKVMSPGNGYYKNSIKVLRSDALPKIFATLPLDVDLICLFFFNGSNVLYDFNRTETQMRYALGWLQDQSKWTEEILNALSNETYAKLLGYNTLVFLAGIMPLPKVLEFMDKVFKDYLAYRDLVRRNFVYEKVLACGYAAGVIWDAVIIRIMTRKDITPEYRKWLASIYPDPYREHPSMLSAAFQNTGMTAADVADVMEAWLKDADKFPSDAAVARMKTEVNHLRREEKCLTK